MEPQLFEIAGEVVEAQDPALQQLLERVHGTSTRPRCLCVTGGVEMYVARHWRYVIKRLPGTGKSHAPSCPAYELDPGVSGRQQLSDAIDERAGQFLLRVDFPWARTVHDDGQGERTLACAEGQAERKVLRRMSLKALTHFLFDQAGFTRWSPAMDGKRTQGVLQKYLQQAAADLIVQGVPLSERLYVPEPFSEATHQAAARRRREKLAFLQPTDGRYPLAVVIGEFKGVERGAAGYRLWIKHLPDAPLLASAPTWQRIERAFAAVLEARDADGPVQARLLVTALIRARRENTYELDTACLSLSSDQWVLVDHPRELPLVNALVAQRRRFFKPLRYDLRSGAPIPNVLLLDAGRQPVGMHVLSPFMKPAERRAKEAAIATATGPVWSWETGTPVPPLPPIDWVLPGAGVASGGRVAAGR
jgi:Protein of unknown function (DUF1173)